MKIKGCFSCGPLHLCGFPQVFYNTFWQSKPAWFQFGHSLALKAFTLSWQWNFPLKCHFFQMHASATIWMANQIENNFFLFSFLWFICIESLSSLICFPPLFVYIKSKLKLTNRGEWGHSGEKRITQWGLSVFVDKRSLSFCFIFLVKRNVHAII